MSKLIFNPKDKTLMSEENLTKEQLYEFTQWYRFNYGNDGYTGDYPREDMIDLVSEYIKTHSSNKGFVKWVATELQICDHLSKEEFDKHFAECTEAIIGLYIEAKQNNTLFQLTNFTEMFKDLIGKEGFKVIIDGEEIKHEDLL